MIKKRTQESKYRIHRFVDGCGQEKLILDEITNKEHVSKIKEMVIDDSKNIQVMKWKKYNVVTN